MRHRLLSRLGRAAAACLLASLATAAQQSPPDAAPQEAKAQEAGAAAGLVVEVEYFKGVKPIFQPVPRDSWYGRFGTLAAPRPRAAADKVLAVDVKTRPADGGRVEIRVGVHVGVRHFDRLEPVGTYHAAVGETVTAAELVRVGVEPFVFRVLPVVGLSSAAPSVVNLTQSIEAVVTDFTPAPLPRGRLTLRNLSSKRVRAVYLMEVVGGSDGSQGFMAEREGKIVMEPGGSAEKDFGVVSGETSDAGFVPAAVKSLVVASVLFDDYTCEGEPRHAALKRAQLEGQRAQLPELIALVRAAQAAPDAETDAAVRRLSEKVASLGYAALPAAV